MICLIQGLWVDEIDLLGKPVGVVSPAARLCRGQGLQQREEGAGEPKARDW